MYHIKNKNNGNNVDKNDKEDQNKILREEEEVKMKRINNQLQFNDSMDLENFVEDSMLASDSEKSQNCKETQISLCENEINNFVEFEEKNVEKSNIIDDDDDNDEIVSNYTKENKNCVDNLIINKKLQSLVNQARFNNQWSVMNNLGKGSFGTVLKVISYVDNQIYAIKKISNCSDHHVFRESRILAKLSNIYHPNIVRYYSSWVELDHQDSSIVKNSNSSDSTNQSISCIKSNDYNNNTDDMFLSNISLKDSNDEILAEFSKDHCNTKFNDLFINTLPFKFTLYIQMEYCDTSLDKWLHNRNQLLNPQRTIMDFNLRDCFFISRQLINAISFIHHNNIIHMDLRPTNIFVQLDPLAIKVGDFGISLSTEFNNAFKSDIIGPSYYFPPESEISTKRDVYSLGVVLFEIFTPFNTISERHHVLNTIRHECCLPSFFDKSNYLFWLTSKMVSRDPQDRPDLRSIIDEELEFVQNTIFADSKYDNHHNKNNNNLHNHNHESLEIQYLQERIKYLENLLLKNGIECK